ERSIQRANQLALEAELASVAKGEFLANMSHEIRTPMTAIMGFTDLLMSYEMSPSERREHLQTIQRNAENLLTIINDILDLSKIEADKIELERADCTPQEIVDGVVSLMKIRANAKNLSLDGEYVYPLPAVIHTDAVRLRQILVNLVGNAVKFTEQGRVRITVRYAAGSEGSPPQLAFEVTDTGIGMEPEDMDRLFQPFVQVDASHTRRFGGTGLGLSISGRLAKMLGGRIDVQSRPGRGSTFTVSIDPGPMDNVPLLDSRPSATDYRRPPVDLPPGQVLSGRVLLVEDSPDIRHMVLLVLQRWGLETDVACNGRIACEKALQSKAVGSPYDLILMDIQLPEMDGYQATQYLRHHDWTGPVVALTAHAMSGDRQRCLAAGCDDYVPKPITAEELLETLAGYLGNGSAAESQSAERPADKRPPDRPLGSGILDDAEVTELVDTFVGELPDRAEAIHEAFSAQDLPALTLQTHQLKGTAAIYGLPQISQAAAVANQRASQPDDFEQLEAAVTELIGLCRAAVSHSFERSPEEETR
ncbi:MAG: response regulator, partial [Candidatus Nealsonbacteria bacterium]|nr:response regulator [Candidatus Nealsonbacteria bacterium]